MEFIKSKEGRNPSGELGSVHGWRTLETLLFRLLLSKIISAAVGICVPASSPQCLMPHNHPEMETGKYIWGTKILKDLALGRILISGNWIFGMLLRRLGSGDFIQGCAGFLWQSRSHTSLLPFSGPSFVQCHHKAEVPGDCASALHAPGGSPAPITKWMLDLLRDTQHPELPEGVAVYPFGLFLLYVWAVASPQTCWLFLDWQRCLHSMRSRHLLPALLSDTRFSSVLGQFLICHFAVPKKQPAPLVCLSVCRSWFWKRQLICILTGS